MSKALVDIIAERDRQINQEGWTTQHDDMHTMGEMARAAAVYAMPQAFRDFKVMNDTFSILLWPASWSREWFKPTNKRRDLVKAGALILAEIERLDRI